MKSKTNQYRSLFFKIGLAMSLGIVLLAFEWKSGEALPEVDWTYVTPQAPIDEAIPPMTEIEKPKPPVQNPVFEEVPDEEIIVEEPIIIKEFEPDAIVYEPVTDVIEVVEKEEVIDDKPVIFAEKNAEFKGGIKAFYEYVNKNLDYPRQAKRMGIEGKVFLQFVVDKDGSISNVKLLRGIGGGCDEQAAEVLKNSPKWEPAKQRGRVVRQQMTLPIRFALN